MNAVVSLHSIFYIPNDLEDQAHAVAAAWWAKNSGQFVKPVRGYWLLAMSHNRVVACMSFEHADQASTTITGLYAEPSRYGKAGSGAILDRIHQIADAEQCVLYGITNSQVILEHALRRGWNISGVAVYRAPSPLPPQSLEAAA